MSSIRAGNAFVEIGASTVGVEKAFAKIDQMGAALTKSFQTVGTQISSIGSGAAKAGLAIAGAGAGALVPIAALAKKFADVGSAVADASARTGASASALSAIGYAAEQTGSDLSTVESGFRAMAKSISSGSKDITDLGLDFDQLKQLSPEKQFETIGKKLAAIDDPIERAAKAMAIFGKSGTSLLPLFKDFDALTREARDLGIALSDSDVGAADRLGDSWDRLGKVIQGIGVRIGAAIAGPLANVLEIVAKIGSKAIDWARNNENVIRTAALIGVGFVGVGAAVGVLGASIVALGATVSGVGAIVGGVISAIGAIGAVASAALSPIGLIAAAVVIPVAAVGVAMAGIGAWAVYVGAEATGALDDLGKMFSDLGYTASEAWGGIVAAIQTGDISAAAAIGYKGLQLGWLTAINEIEKAWNKTAGFLKAAANEVARVFAVSGLAAWHSLESSADQAAAFILRVFDEAGAGILNMFDGIDVAIQKAVIEMKKFLGLVDEKTATATQKKLDDELAKRKQRRSDAVSQNAEARQQNIDERAAARPKQIDQANKFFDARTNAALTTTTTPEQKRRQEEIERLRKELAELSGDAKAKAAAATATPTPPPAPGSSLKDRFAARSAVSAQPGAVAAGQAAAASAIQFAGAEAIGSFSGRAVMNQGYISVQQTQTQLLERVATGVETQVSISREQAERERE